MRKQIFGAAALFCLSGTPAHSFTLEQVADMCIPWSEVNFSFEIERLDRVKRNRAMMCMSYMEAFREAGDTNCYLREAVREHGQPDMVFAAFDFHRNYSSQQLAQFTLNFKRDTPDKWDLPVSVLAKEMLPDAKCD